MEQEECKQALVSRIIEQLPEQSLAQLQSVLRLITLGSPGLPHCPLPEHSTELNQSLDQQFLVPEPLARN